CSTRSAQPYRHAGRRGGPESSGPPLFRVPTFCRCIAHSSATLLLIALAGLARVEGVAQAVTDEVDREHREEDHRARDHRFMRAELQEVLGVVEHRAPCRHIVREAEAE